ncbi:MAG: AAA family ATPase [Spirulina sp. SIO3F2]|nr:AAA family ATPase [Spirulina sp. SIO3F2]
MLNLAGYQQTELLYTGTRTLVYRALHLSDEQSVIVKVLRNAHPHFSELIQFRHQYVITQDLDLPFLVKPLALERYDNSYALIMPDQGAVSLAQYWQNAKRELSELLAIAIQLAEALHHLARQQIIHKDIKPANILIHPQTKQIQLIDFSIASLLPKEQRPLINPKGLEGTLAYISPEQTGRMNRGIDYRSDFYALGVTLYELLVGTVPFDQDDPLDLIHAHIAQIPMAPGDILDAQGQFHPQTVSAIIMKLMAKNAEDRYQSALGLKHDLERCLRSLKQTGAVANFELGERDVCDRFLIPEKLYGRGAEVQMLLEAFERVSQGNSELMLVAGYSGVGKTAVANEVHKPITRQKGYFIKGKFEQFNRNTPFSAFVQAFRSLMEQLLGESDAALANWKAQILAAVGENGQVLIEVIPELQHIIGPQPPVPELAGNAAQNRFNLLFGQFIQVFTTPTHPLVIFLDDLQWIDSASLNLFKRLVNEESGYLLVLGTYRDNEVSPAHPLMLTLDEMCQRSTAFKTLTLKPLGEDDINHLVADSLHCPIKLAQPLSQLVYQKTQGNPFFTTQFLQGLERDDWIKFNAEAGYWQCHLTQIKQLALTNNVVEFMVNRLQKLPIATQNVVKLAACIGNQFDSATLALVCEASQDEVAQHLWHGLQAGFVIPENETYRFFQGGEQAAQQLGGITDVAIGYCFLHDRVQQAAYSLVPTDQQQITHLRIGRLLLNNASKNDIDELESNSIFDIVNQINLGAALITSPTEQRQLAKLNFIAGKKAKSETAYRAAFDYSERTLNLLSENAWQEDYEFTLSVYVLATESAYLAGELQASNTLKDRVLEQATCELDQAEVYEIWIQSLVAQNQLLEAIRVGLNFLSGLGVDLPKQPEESDIEQAIGQLLEQLPLEGIESLNSLPRMVTQSPSISMRILSSLLNAAYLGNPNLLPLIVAKQVELSMTYGNMEVSPSAYANYGLILCGIADEIEAGYRFGKLALSLFNTLEAKTFYAKTAEIVGLAVQHWQSPIASTLELLTDGYNIGLETGDFESAAFSAYDYCAHSFVVGKNLISLEKKMRKYSAVISEFQQRMVFNLNELHRQTILNLTDLAQTDELEPAMLSGQAYDEAKMLPIHQEDNDFSSLALLHIDKLFLSYLFGNHRQAVIIAAQAESYLEGIPGQVFVPLFYFYDALSWLSLYPELDEADKEQAIARISSHQARIAKWARYAPMNYAHKLYLLQAEHHRILGQKVDALECYDRAIFGAKENEYLQEEALANECAAKFYLNWGKERIAATYMQEAYYGYARWGAKTKTDDLEANYPQLLIPILQKQRIEFNALDSIDNLTKTLTSTLQSQTQSSSNISEALDFSAILQAAQKLASTIELDELLGDITQIVLTNAGAQKIVLVTPNGQQWQLQACAEQREDGEIITQTLAQTLTVESSVPLHLIQYVRNTQNPVLINEAKTEISGLLEGYLLKHQPQSVLCVPLLNQGKLIAIAYLEHATTKGVFTPNRQTIIEFLCAQAAVALQNAQLYKQAQTALIELQQAQLQLVQSEKMSALGGLVAGVAHEINNPVGFLKGNIQPAQDYVQDLLELIDLLVTKTPSNDLQVQEKLEAVDLEFIREDLPKLISSMNAGIDRIRNISDSLRTFSRKDQDHKTAFNIHNGIDSTLLILKHRTKANEQRPQIQIFKNYGELPEVQCFPGQLNQVFMNVLANAIDAFDEVNRGKTYQEIEVDSNIIEIQTSLLHEQVEVQIRDNGCGMRPETVERIFEQGFTTKAVGNGTGLGMAIAHQIITEKHNGSITCTSELGQGSLFVITIPCLEK